MGWELKKRILLRYFIFINLILILKNKKKQTKLRVNDYFNKRNQNIRETLKEVT